MQPCNRIYDRSPHAYVNQRLQIQLELLMMSGMPLEICWALSSRSQIWVGTQFPLRLDYGRSPHAFVNQSLQIQLELLMMSGMPLVTCWAFNERWNNKFYYKVASYCLFLLRFHHISNVCSFQVFTTGVITTCIINFFWLFGETGCLLLHGDEFVFKCIVLWLREGNSSIDSSSDPSVFRKMRLLTR